MTSLSVESAPAPPIRTAGSLLVDLMFAAAAATLFFHAEIFLTLGQGIHVRAPLNAPLMVLAALLTLIGFASDRR